MDKVGAHLTVHKTLGVRAHRIANWLCTSSAQTPLCQASLLCNSSKTSSCMWAITLNHAILHGEWQWRLGQRIWEDFGRFDLWIVCTCLAPWQLLPLQAALSAGTKGSSACKFCIHRCIQWIKWTGWVRSIEMHSLKFERYSVWEKFNNTKRGQEAIRIISMQDRKRYKYKAAQKQNLRFCDCWQSIMHVLNSQAI